MKQYHVAVLLVCGWIVLFGAGWGGVSDRLAEAAEQNAAWRYSRPEAQVLVASNSDTQTRDDADFDMMADEAITVPETAHVADPLEPWNRAMFVFNDKCYFWVLKPVAQGYSLVMPKFFRECIRNFFTNIEMPVRLVNCVLQAKGKAAAGELGRFLCNTTVGVLGFGNPARKYPALSPDEEDFGQTLGRYGIGQGIYIVWPLLGPSTLRDTLGYGGDHFLKPTTYIEPWSTALAVNGGDRINRVSLVIGDYETFKAGAFEPYAAARDAYIQYRKGKVAK